MGHMYWIKRFALALVAAFLVLTAVQLLKGAVLESALSFGALWGLIFASIFTGTGYLRFRRNPSCMLPTSRD